MRKLTLLLLSVAVALSAAAGVKAPQGAYRPMGKTVPTGITKSPSRVDIITEQPEGTVVDYMRGGEYITASFYGYESAVQTGRVKVVYAPDGKTVYIKDPLCYGEGQGVWVHGELSSDGQYITVPLGQYVSYDETYGYGLVLAWGSTVVYEMEDDEGVFYWMDFVPDDRIEEAVYAIDAADGTITLLDCEGDMNKPYPYDCEATGLAGVWSDDGICATIEWNSTWRVLGDAVPAVPANPEVLEFFDSGHEDGYTRMDFNINLVDVDGNPLHPDYLTYSIFTDEDQLFTFDYETYGALNGFETDMTEIPYAFSGEDFYLRRVYFYRTNMGDNPMFKWRIGIQLNYTVGQVTNKSDIVYLEVYPKPTAVNEVNTDKSVTGVRYYNVAGQEMAQPSGLTIQVTTYSDGTTATTKVVR